MDTEPGEPSFAQQGWRGEQLTLCTVLPKRCPPPPPPSCPPSARGRAPGKRRFRDHRPPQVSSDQGLEAAKCLMSSCGHSKSGHFVPPERSPATRRRKPALQPQAGEHPPVTAVPVTSSRAIHNQSAGPKSFRGSGVASVGPGREWVCTWPGVWAGGWGRGDLHGVTASPAGLLRDTWSPASVSRVRSRTPERGQDVGWGPALQPGRPLWPEWPDLSNEDT